MASKKLTQAHFDQWMHKYKEAWEQFDADLALSLFAPNASYYETPFHYPITGYDNLHAYWTSAPHYQKDVNFEYEIITLKGNTGYATWRVTYYQWATGETVTLDGVFEVKFSSDGLCSQLKSWWHRFAQILDTYPTG
jgi:hypothetical protein